MYAAQSSGKPWEYNIIQDEAAIAAVVGPKDLVWKILEALNFHQALAPSDDLLKAVCAQAIENDDLKDKLAAADARIERLKDVIMQLDETLEEALRQLRLDYK